MNLNETVHEPITWSVVLATLLVFLALAGCDSKSQGPPPRPVPQVSTITVQPEKLMLTTELPGRTSAFRVADIRPQVSGLIQKRLFTEGSEIKAGQVLYQIDPVSFQATLDNANAALGRSEANLSTLRSRADRYKELLADRAVSQQDYDDAAAALTQVEADIQYWQATVKSARINMGYTKVTAPISGRIGKSNVSAGAIVTAYQPTPLTTIQQLDPIYADIPRSTTDMLRLKSRQQDGLINQQEKGQDKVQLILEDGTPYPLEGTLQFSDVTVDPTTGSFIMRVVFPNPESVILPGMFVRTMIKEGVDEQAILIPQQGVSRDPKGNPFALVVDAESKASFRPLTLDRAIGDTWLVSSGLAPGDRVIVEGLLMLRPGTVVKAAPFDPNKDGQGSTSAHGAPPQKRSEGGE